MKHVDSFGKTKKSPKKETIAFLLSFSKTFKAILTGKDQHWLVCKN